MRRAISFWRRETSSRQNTLHTRFIARIRTDFVFARIDPSRVFVRACDNRNLPDVEAARAKMERRKWRGLTLGDRREGKMSRGKRSERERDRTENGCLASLGFFFFLGRHRLWHQKQGGRRRWNAWRKKRLIGNTYCDRRKRAMREGGGRKRGKGEERARTLLKRKDGEGGRGTKGGEGGL